YTFGNVIKPLSTIFLAWLTYILVIQRRVIKLPRVAEQFEHLIGGMSLMLIVLFWLLLGNQTSLS
ncbi:MAG: cation:proton antiporter, partial [Crocosphaera sp.]